MTLATVELKYEPTADWLKRNCELPSDQSDVYRFAGVSESGFEGLEATDYVALTAGFGQQWSEFSSVAEEGESWQGGQPRPVKLLDMRASKRPMRTFADDHLEQDFLSYCQLACPEVLTPAKIAARRQELLHASADYLHLPQFDLPNAEQHICGSVLIEPVADPFEAMQEGLEELLFAKMCTHRLLEKEEELRVITRMHYYKMLAHRLLSDARVDQWALARAEGLMRASQWHRGLIAHANMRLIVSIVRKLPTSPDLYDELVSDGVLGLMRALDRFDPTRGYRFCTYATTVIRRECFDHLQEKVEQRKQCMTSAKLSVLSAIKGLDQPKSDRTHMVTWRRKLLTLLSKLSERERTILRYRYGLGDETEAMPLQRIADILKLSKERVRQLERTALEKLKSWASKKVIASDEDRYDWSN